MAAGEGDSDWGGDAPVDTTTTEELLPAGRSSNLDHLGQQHVRLQEEELHHFLLNKEEAAAAAETHVSLRNQKLLQELRKLHQMSQQSLSANSPCL